MIVAFECRFACVRSLHRALTDREKGYSTTEKEALAIVFATDHFRPYLLGKIFSYYRS